MRFIFTILLMLLITGSVLIAQSDIYQFNIQGNGARSAGMGYAFTGLADDATAITTNPAGIAQLGTFEFSFVTRADFGYGSFSFPDEYNWPINEATFSEASNFDLNFASFVFPFPLGNMSAAVGLAYRRYVNFNLEQTVKIDGQQQSDPYEVEGGIQTLTGAGAIAVTPNIFLGGAGNIFFGSRQVVGSDFKLEFSGFKLDGGLLFKAGEKFSVGAMITLPWTLGRTFSYPGLDDLPRDYSMPFTASFGATIRPLPALTLAADFRLRPLSKVSYENAQNETIEGFWENVNSFHVGAEFVIPIGAIALPLRAGLYTLPTVAKDFNANNPPDYEGEQITGIVLTGGGGLVLGAIVLDLSMELGIIGDYYVYSQFDDFNTGEPIPWTVSQGFFRINMGVVVHIGDLIN